MPLTAFTCIFLPDRANHLDLSRNDIELLAYILTDALKLMTIRTDLLFFPEIDNYVFSGEIRRKMDPFRFAAPLVGLNLYRWSFFLRFF